MVEPPVDAGALQVTTEEALPFEVPLTLVGAPGTVAGVTALEAREGNPEPTPLVATTVKV